MKKRIKLLFLSLALSSGIAAPTSTTKAMPELSARQALEQLERRLGNDFDVVEKLNYSFRGDDQRYSLSGWSDADASFSTFRKGLPFRLHLNSLSEDQVLSREEGEKALLNALSQIVLEPEVSKNFEVHHFSGASRALLSGHIRRVSPALAFPEKTNYFLREYVDISPHANSNSIGFLSYRLLSRDSDVLWVNSPSLNKSWKAPATLRGDGLLDTNLSLDELDGLSLHPSLISVQSAVTSRAMLPFASSSYLQLEQAQGDCLLVPSDEASPAEQDVLRHWHFESTPKSSIPWWSGRAFFTKRNVIEVSFVVRDLLREELIYQVLIDAESYLPIVILKKSLKEEELLVLNFFGMASGTGHKLPVLDFSLVAQLPGFSEVTLIDYFRHRLCPAEVAQQSFSSLDPNKVGSQPARNAAGLKEPTT